MEANMKYLYSTEGINTDNWVTVPYTEWRYDADFRRLSDLLENHKSDKRFTFDNHALKFESEEDAIVISLKWT